MTKTIEDPLITRMRSEGLILSPDNYPELKNITGQDSFVTKPELEELKKAWKENRLGEYLGLRDNFSDEIPAEKASSRYQYTHKVAKNWWASLMGGISTDLRLGLITEDIRPAVENFYKKYTPPTYDFEGNTDEQYPHPLGEVTSTENISEANNILDLLLGPNHPRPEK